MRRKEPPPSKPFVPDAFFIGSTETEHAIIDCYEVSIGRIVLRWKSKHDDVVHEDAFWRPAHTTPEQIRDIIREKIYQINELARDAEGAVKATHRRPLYRVAGGFDSHRLHHEPSEVTP